MPRDNEQQAKKSLRGVPYSEGQVFGVWTEIFHVHSSVHLFKTEQLEYMQTKKHAGCVTQLASLCSVILTSIWILHKPKGKHCWRNT